MTKLQEKIKAEATASYKDFLSLISKKLTVPMEELENLMVELCIKKEIVEILEESELSVGTLIELGKSKEPLDKIYEIFVSGTNKEVIAEKLKILGDNYLKNSNLNKIEKDVDKVCDNYN